MSMTPRTQDVDGLSASKYLPANSGSKIQVIDTAKLSLLEAYCDNELTGHVCIRPKDMLRMQEWIDSRGQSTHPFTSELLNAIVPRNTA